VFFLGGGVKRDVGPALLCARVCVCVCVHVHVTYCRALSAKHLVLDEEIEALGVVFCSRSDS